MATRYTRTAIGLHWLMAVLIVGGFGLGLIMTELALSPQKLKLYAYHKWIGVTVFVLLWWRLIWRLTHPAPALPPMPAWQQRAAAASHVLLYALMFAVPLSGWLMSSAGGFQTVWFGVLPLPDLLNKDQAVFDALKILHRALNYSFGVLVLIHALAALLHHFRDHDDVLRRMLPHRESI